MLGESEQAGKKFIFAAWAFSTCSPCYNSAAEVVTFIFYAVQTRYRLYRPHSPTYFGVTLPIKTDKTFLTLAIATVIATSLAGCQIARDPQPLAAKYYTNDVDAQMEFWHTLAQRKLATNDEAFHGMLLYLDTEDKADSYEGRVSVMKSRHLLPADFSGKSDEAVTRGTLAVPIARALQIKGGLMMTAIGPTPRYATRELQYLGLYPPSSPNQIFSGAEFVGIIGKLDDHQNGVAAPVTDRLAEK